MTNYHYIIIMTLTTRLAFRRKPDVRPDNLVLAKRRSDAKVGTNAGHDEDHDALGKDSSR